MQGGPNTHMPLTIRGCLLPCASSRVESLKQTEADAGAAALALLQTSCSAICLSSPGKNSQRKNACVCLRYSVGKLKRMPETDCYLATNVCWLLLLGCMILVPLHVQAADFIHFVP